MKIGVLKKQRYGAVEYYRIRPWSVLQRLTGVQVTAIDPHKHGNYELDSLDVLVCHAPATEIEMKIMLLAHRSGCKVVNDYDDLVFETHRANPASKFWGKDATRMDAVECMMIADKITVSTQTIKEEFEKRFRIKGISLLPNAFDNMARRLWPKPKIRKKPLILWRGSNTHEADIKAHVGAFVPLDNTDYMFLGYDPMLSLSTDYGGNLTDIQFKEGISEVKFYFDNLLNLRPTYVVVPLENNHFNKGKSNIAWQEATWAGAVTIAPSYMPEFNNVSCIHYESVDDLREIFERIDVGETFDSLLVQARHELETRYLLSNVNELRVDLLNDLMNYIPGPAEEVAREGGATL